MGCLGSLNNSRDGYLHLNPCEVRVLAYGNVGRLVPPSGSQSADSSDFSMGRLRTRHWIWFQWCETRSKPTTTFLLTFTI